MDVFFLMIPHPPRSTLFPSTTLFQSAPNHGARVFNPRLGVGGLGLDQLGRHPKAVGRAAARRGALGQDRLVGRAHGLVDEPADRKSTRPNSSHAKCSYSVF